MSECGEDLENAYKQQNRGTAALSNREVGVNGIENEIGILHWVNTGRICLCAVLFETKGQVLVPHAAACPEREEAKQNETRKDKHKILRRNSDEKKKQTKQREEKRDPAWVYTRR